MFVLATIVALATTGPASAVVPQHIQQRAQLRAILELRELSTFFPIVRIEVIAPNLWRLTAGRCHIDVSFLLTRSDRPGQSRRAPHVGQRVCQP